MVSPDNRSRTEINQAIRVELQSKGIVGKEQYRIQVHVPRQDLTGADRTWAERYNVGDVLRYSRGSKETGIGKGEYARVTGVDAANNWLTVAEGRYRADVRSTPSAGGLHLSRRGAGRLHWRSGAAYRAGA